MGKFKKGLSSKRKAVLRGIRLSVGQNRSLEEDAKKKGVSVNSFLSTLITKYAERNRLAAREEDHFFGGKNHIAVFREDG